MLAAVVAIALGLDTGFLTRVSLASTGPLEQRLVDTVRQSDDAVPSRGRHVLKIEGTLPSLSGADQWLNTDPLTADGLKGSVVLVDFWTYSCINCCARFPT